MGHFMLVACIPLAGALAIALVFIGLEILDGCDRPKGPGA